MDLQSRLIAAIKQNNPESLKQCLNEEPAYIRSILDQKYSGFLLHLTAKFDTRNHSDLTSVLLNEFDADPNIRNSGDSLPIYWALAESSKSVSSNLHTIEVLMKHRKFALYQKDKRVCPLEFIRTHYLGPPHGPKIRAMLEERLWKDRVLAIFMWKRHKLQLE